jgi:very-short-patch-repair endonuclease
MQKQTLLIAKELRKNQTPQEIILWSRLRAKKFNKLKFRRQHPIGRYIVDFVCYEKKLIIGLDGRQHKEDDRKEYDRVRTEFLKGEGFKVLRFWNNDVNKNLNGILVEIEKHTAHPLS